jgi:uncharacterized protein YkuJ
MLLQILLQNRIDTIRAMENEKKNRTVQRSLERKGGVVSDCTASSTSVKMHRLRKEKAADEYVDLPAIPDLRMQEKPYSFCTGGFRAILHKDPASDAQSDFLSDETKSGMHTLCMHEHFCEI